jgi:DNA-binding CsgD family transcriptional regulator
MITTAERNVDELLREARTWEAALLADAMRTQSDDPALRRFAAGIFAIAGRRTALAGVVEPALLAARSSDDVEHVLHALPDGPNAFDFAAAATIVSWRGDADETYRLLRSGAARAIEMQLPHLAIAIDERLAQHALMFGNIDVAQRATATALQIATPQRHANWHWRCSATSARLYSAAGDNARAGEMLAHARAAASSDVEALFAPIAATLAAATDGAPAPKATGPDLQAIALNDERPNVAASAAMGWAMVEPPGDAGPSPASNALRRAVFRGSDGLDVIELYSIVARYGEVDDARIAVAALLAVASFGAPYADAHAQLARAYILFRTARNDAGAASAGDAARAFASAGMRGWTNEAMLLLVRHEGESSPSRRRPSALSLTGRERQVAQLIRRGSSNRDVARVLDISEHTVERHVSSILSRLGLRSRWQLVDERTDEP